MGRAERRRAERNNRIENNKNKIHVSREDLADIKQKISHDVSGYSVEVLMTCFALALRRTYGFGQKRIFRALLSVEELMQGILDDTTTMEDYKKILEDETGVVVKCND